MTKFYLKFSEDQISVFSLIEKEMRPKFKTNTSSLNPKNYWHTHGLKDTKI
jgi:hypothetical protein